MKKTILGTVVCLGALMGTASAQMVDTVKVTLPFAASVGGVTLPAGEYTIRNLEEDGSASVMQISTYKGKSVAAIAVEVIAPKNQTPSETKVVLKQDGDGYKIDSIWLQGEEIGYEFLSK
ncbi:MAG: hypothetical protein ABSF22_06125 [Bryobacteraceae bacterium]|jgi:hypothetical protein